MSQGTLMKGGVDGKYCFRMECRTLRPAWAYLPGHPPWSP